MHMAHGTWHMAHGTWHMDMDMDMDMVHTYLCPCGSMEGNRALAGTLLAAHLAAMIASKGAMQAASVPDLCARGAGSGGSVQR